MAMIKTYQQNLSKRAFPNEQWRCDIVPPSGPDHHGVGENEAEAILNAAFAYWHWERVKEQTDE